MTLVEGGLNVLINSPSFKITRKKVIVILDSKCNEVVKRVINII